MLFAVCEVHDYSVFVVQVFCQVLCAVHRAVLPAGASKGKHEVREATLEIAFYVGIGQSIDRVEERQDLPVLFQEADDRFVQARQLLVRLIAPGVVRGAAVKDIPATIAAGVLGDATFVGEGEDADEKRPTPNPPYKGGSGHL